MNNEEMINNCEQFEILIDSYVDGEIMPHEKITLEHHLLSCPGCKRYMEDITSLLEKTAYLPKQVPLDKEKKDLFWENIQHSAARVSQNGASVVNGPPGATQGDDNGQDESAGVPEGNAGRGRPDPLDQPALHHRPLPRRHLLSRPAGDQRVRGRHVDVHP